MISDDVYSWVHNVGCDLLPVPLSPSCFVTICYQPCPPYHPHSYWHGCWQMVISPGILPGPLSRHRSSPPPPSSTFYAMLQKCKALHSNWWLSKQTNYSQNTVTQTTLDDAACTVVIDGLMNWLHSDQEYHWGGSIKIQLKRWGVSIGFHHVFLARTLRWWKFPFHNLPKGTECC